MPIQDIEGQHTKHSSPHQSTSLRRPSISLQRASLDTDSDSLMPPEQADGTPALPPKQSAWRIFISRKRLWLVILAFTMIIIMGIGVIAIPHLLHRSSAQTHAANHSSQPKQLIGSDGERPAIRPSPTPQPPTPTITPVPIIGTQYVAAATPSPGTSTGITIPLHATIDISAYGIASFVPATNADCTHASYTDPDGNLYYETTKADLCGKGPLGSTTPMPSVPIGTLIGRIGTGPWMVIGSHATFTAQTTGTLFLLYNDSDWNDNTGGYNVNLHIQP